MKVRHIVLGLLSISVIAPIFLYTDRVGSFVNPSSSRRDFLDDVSAFTVSGDTRHLNVLHQETSTALKEPIGVVYSDHSTVTREHKSTRVLSATDEERQHQQLSNPIRQVIDRAPPGLTITLDSHPNASDISAIELEQQPTQPSGKIVQEHSDNKHDRLTEPADAQVRHLKDQLIRAKVYLSLPAIKNNPHVTRELRLRVKEVTRALGDATKDSDLPKNAVDKLKAMDQSLEKGKQIQDDCAAVVKKLRAMLHSSEEQLRVHKKQTMFLTQLTAKTLPKGLHCLPLRLTTEYYTLNSSQQNFPNQQKLEDPRLYHYALFSDNILAAAVVVNSTISHAKHPSDHVFHIVTDRLNYAAMRMWFLSNPPRKATIQVQNIEEFTWLNSSYSPVLKQLGSPSMIDYYFRAHRASSDSNLKFRNPKYLSILNHLRFYLPEIFPKLNKVLFLDDDIVVQKDLTGLWSLDLKGNVNGAVETCGESFHRFDRYLNFSNPLISKNFDPHACGWAYGMNIFDLAEWRRQNITEVYHRWQRLNRDRQLWKLGTLPPGLITFWKRTYSLDKSWHVLGLGYNPNVNQREIDRAAVIHYNGNLKPWLEIGIPKYKIYWAKYVDYETVYLRECNINP
ncbi:putative galacturonosyltransferase 4 [Gossypium australe]|uniref:Hexosyltransferase n=1 Tax=Gossypium australe TaxID=47621 RepID=A0A5B6W8Y0_9ROSI|nr:putative galacturonosyltransferase 4 [Gossypium australe]